MNRHDVRRRPKWRRGLAMTAACGLLALASQPAWANDADELRQLRAQMKQAQEQMAAQSKAMQAMQDRLNTLETQQTQTTSLSTATAAATAQTAQQAADRAQSAQVAADAAQKAAYDMAHSTKPPGDGSLSYYGITLYGTVDVGFGYQSHGAPLSQYWPDAVNYLVSKNGNKGTATFTSNGLSQSKIGLKGSEEIADGWSAVFKLETGFNPQSGQLADGPGSIAANNGLATTKQTGYGDSSHAGQAFNRAAYAGVSSPVWGTLTVGRQNSLVADNVFAYDPQGASYAFSVIGFSGVAGGGGDTEDFRLDNAVKYTNKIGPVRVGALYQFGEDNGGMHGNALEFDVGSDIGGLSFDAAFAHKQNAVSVGPLTAAQVTQVQALGYSPRTSLAGTISDNDAYSLMASYTLDRDLKFFAGYEYIDYSNPSVPLQAGTTDIGGYTLAIVNNTAFPHDKILQVVWGGAKYAVTSKVDLTGAYYHYGQNSYGAKSCSDTSAATCSGTLNAWSMVADYRFAKRFDAYLGFMYSQVSGGQAAGYLYNNDFAPTTGVRFNF